MAAWSVGGLVGWRVSWSVGRSVGRLVGWLVVVASVVAVLFVVRPAVIHGRGWRGGRGKGLQVRDHAS